MATRCNIVISNLDQKKKIYLYHHFDWYPIWVGWELIQIFSKIKSNDLSDYSMNNFIKNNLTKDYEDTKGLHGDIAYIYNIEFSKINWYLNIIVEEISNNNKDKILRMRNDNELMKIVSIELYN